MSREPDRTWPDMQVHEIIYDSALQVVLDAVDDHLGANVHDLEVGEVTLVAVLVNRLVDLLIHLDPVPEVQGSLLRILSLVVRAGSLDIPNVGHDQVLVVAFGFDKEHLNALAGALLVDPLAPILGRIGCIEDTNDATLTEPFDHVGDGCLGGHSSSSFALGIRCVEEIGRRVRSVGSSVVAHIEGLGIDGEPLEISLGYSKGKTKSEVSSESFSMHGQIDLLTLLCYETLPARWKANHHHADLSVLGLDTAAISASSPCHDRQILEFSAVGS